MGRHCDTISVCLSRTGAPVGSLLCGSKETIRRAHRYRKMLGGGMRQRDRCCWTTCVNFHIEGLADDHRRADNFAEEISALYVSLNPTDVLTNIVIFETPSMPADEVCGQLLPWVKVLPFGLHRVRAVFHRDIDDVDLSVR